MKRTEKAYIQICLGTATWNVDLEHNGEQDILDEGIDCYPDEVYELIYEGYECSEDKLKMLLSEPDNSKNMLYPLDCFRELSYNDWLDYKKEMDLYEVERIKAIKEATKEREARYKKERAEKRGA